MILMNYRPIVKLSDIRMASSFYCDLNILSLKAARPLTINQNLYRFLKLSFKFSLQVL
jgi:hypothetical protein